MTFDGKHGFVVRGGNSCATRTVSPGFEKSPARGALCCEPAIAIKTSNSHPAFLKAVSAKLAKLEKAINDRSASSFSDLCDDELEFYGKSSLSRNRVESLVGARSVSGQTSGSSTMYATFPSNSGEVPMTIPGPPSAASSPTGRVKWPARSRNTCLAVAKPSYSRSPSLACRATGRRRSAKVSVEVQRIEWRAEHFVNPFPNA